MIELGILDQSPISEGSSPAEALAQTTRLAQAADAWGYRRFWVSEHHFSGSLAGSSPEVLIAHLAANTKVIRVGSGGVMLPHYSAYKVAENFRVLEALYPGRIDLGIGRAPGGMPLAARALQEGKTPGDRYPEQVADLIGYLHDALPSQHRFSGLRATPSLPTAPPVWMLGSTSGSAVLAAKAGTAFAYAHFINGRGGEEAMEWYQTHFEPSATLDRPKSLVALIAVCAETDEEADRVAASMDLMFLLYDQGVLPEHIPSPETAASYPYSAFDRQRIRENRHRAIVGSPARVKERILHFSEVFGTENVVVVTFAHDFEARLRSYRLLAEAFGLK